MFVFKGLINTIRNGRSIDVHAYTLTIEFVCCCKGVFVQRCVLEYKRLTFSQLVRLHTSLLSLQQTEQTTDTCVQVNMHIHLPLRIAGFLLVLPTM